MDRGHGLARLCPLCHRVRPAFVSSTPPANPATKATPPASSLLVPPPPLVLDASGRPQPSPSAPAAASSCSPSSSARAQASRLRRPLRQPCRRRRPAGQRLASSSRLLLRLPLSLSNPSLSQILRRHGRPPLLRPGTDPRRPELVQAVEPRRRQEWAPRALDPVDPTFPMPKTSPPLRSAPGHRRLLASSASPCFPCNERGEASSPR